MPSTPPGESVNNLRSRLAHALDLPETVTICGSTRFWDEMADVDRALTWSGHIVIKPGCNMKTEDPLWADPAQAEAGKARLDDLHRAKIRMADWVLVVGDYIGNSTRAEILYAKSIGVPVLFTDQTLADEFHSELWHPPVPGGSPLPTAATVVFDQRTTLQLTSWTAEAFGDEFVVTGHLARTSVWPTVGDQVPIKRLELPGRGSMNGIAARVTLGNHRHDITLTIGFAISHLTGDLA